MAGDTRDLSSSPPSNSSSEGSSTTPSHNDTEPSSAKKTKHELPKSQVGKLWDAFGNPEEPVNISPGATYDPNRQKPKDLSVMESVKSLSMKDVTTFYKAPCARDSLMMGMGVGFAAGGIRAVVGGFRGVMPACNWAVGTFALASLISHEFCQRQRVKELDGMKQAVELMRELKIKKQKDEERMKLAKEAARLEEEKKRKSWTNLSNYKFW